MLARVSSSAAPPLNLPAGFASFTMPVALAPFGMATLPSTSIGSRTVAENCWPGVLILEPTVSSRTTEITVSAGTTMGLGLGGACLTAGLAELASAAGEDELASVAAPCCWSVAFWHPDKAKRKPNADKHAVARERFMYYLRFGGGLIGSLKDTTNSDEVNLEVINQAATAASCPGRALRTQRNSGREITNLKLACAEFLSARLELAASESLCASG